MTFIVIIARQTVIYKLRGNPMLFALFYVIAIAILILIGDLYGIVTGRVTQTISSEAEKGLAVAAAHKIQDPMRH